MTARITEAQYPLVTLKKLGIANIGTGNGVDIQLPPGAFLRAIKLYTDTAFNSATTATATVGDGTTTFVNAVDIKTTGAETVANTPKYYPTGGTLTCTLAETGTAATVGVAFFEVDYVVENRGNEILV